MRAVTSPTGFSAAQRDPALWRSILSALLVFSFFWLSFAAQIHIHGQPATAATLAKNIQLDGGQTIPAPATPDKPADCPLCQAVSLGGAAVVPVLIALPVLQSIVRSIVPRPSERLSRSHVGRAHQTRGPPIL